jgi:hypothetical protein
MQQEQAPQPQETVPSPVFMGIVKEPSFWVEAKALIEAAERRRLIE